MERTLEIPLTQLPFPGHLAMEAIYDLTLRFAAPADTCLGAI